MIDRRRFLEIVCKVSAMAGVTVAAPSLAFSSHSKEPNPYQWTDKLPDKAGLWLRVTPYQENIAGYKIQTTTPKVHWVYQVPHGEHYQYYHDLQNGLSGFDHRDEGKFWWSYRGPLDIPDGKGLKLPEWDKPRISSYGGMDIEEPDIEEEEK